MIDYDLSIRLLGFMAKCFPSSIEYYGALFPILCINTRKGILGITLDKESLKYLDTFIEKNVGNKHDALLPVNATIEQLTDAVNSFPTFYQTKLKSPP